MSTYREIVGKKIKKVSSDPSTGTDGEMWYNSTTGTLRALGVSQAWVSSSLAITQMHAGQGFGSATDAVGAGGYDPGSSPGYVNPTDEYNGSGWSAGAAIGTARYTGSGCGSQTAGLIAGGNDGTGGANLDVEEYNGTSWAEQTNLSTGHGYGWMAGIQTAAICYSGLSNPSPATITVNAEEYNGSSWTEVGNVNTGKYGILGFGATQDTAVKVGGTSANTGVEEWNGSSWTAVNSIPANRADGMGSGAQTAGLIAAGNPGGMTSTLTYDGTNWTTSAATLSETRAANARGATIANNATGIIHHAGPGTPKMKLTEEYNSSTNVVTAAAWASGGAYPAATYEPAGRSGPATDALNAGGGPPGALTTANTYDGTSWTGITAMGTASRQGQGAGATSTSGIMVSGITNPGYTFTPAVQEWNGSSWATKTAAPAVRNRGAAGGTVTALVVAGGTNAPDSYEDRTNVTNEWDGSSWTSTGNINTVRDWVSGGGTQTSGIIFGGDEPPGPPHVYSNKTETYNGSSWTVGSTLVTARYSGGGSASSSSDALFYAGLSAPGTPGAQVATEGYDGSAWSTRPSMSTGRGYVGYAGKSSTAAIVIGGDTIAPSVQTATEEFSGETTAANITNFTTS